MSDPPRSGPVSIGLFSAFFALGIASAATRHPHADRSAVVRASGTGRLVGDMAARVLGRWPGLRPLPARWRWWDGLDGG